jgi:hypothetical protein
MAYGVPVYVGWDQLEAAVRKKARIPGVNPTPGCTDGPRPRWTKCTHGGPDSQRGVLALDGDQMRVPVRAPPLPTSASTRALSLAWRAICTAHVPVARPSDGLRNRESKGRQAPHPSGRHQKAKAYACCARNSEISITLIRPGALDSSSSIELEAAPPPRTRLSPLLAFATGAALR